MSKPAVATAGPAEEQTGRKMPVIPGSHVTLNYEGFAWRELMVRLPEGVIADDLKEPALWQAVQSDPNKALRPHDRVYIVAFDESWVAEALVSQAGRSFATLTKPRITEFTTRRDAFYQDENYAVRWVGTGFAAGRQSDQPGRGGEPYRSRQPVGGPADLRPRGHPAAGAALAFRLGGRRTNPRRI